MSLEREIWESLDAAHSEANDKVVGEARRANQSGLTDEQLGEITDADIGALREAVVRLARELDHLKADGR